MIRVIDDNGEEILDLRERLRKLEENYADLIVHYSDMMSAMGDIEDLCYDRDIEDVEDLMTRLNRIEGIAAKKIEQKLDLENDDGYF